MNDWIRLLVKYKGTCSACGKEISAGQYALWSKSSKAIKHSECKASQPPATTKKKEAGIRTGSRRRRQQQRLIALSAAGLSQATTTGLRPATMADGQYCRRLSAIDVWKTRMPTRTTKMHSLKRFTE
jgi:hypothetical protein